MDNGVIEDKCKSAVRIIAMTLKLKVIGRLK